MIEERNRNIGEGYQIRPFFLCIDVSGSMGPQSGSHPGPIDLVNEELDNLLKMLHKDKEVSETIKIALISFAEAAELELPLSGPDKVMVMPKLQAGGQTSYLQPLRKLRELIEEDYRNRKPNKWYRPVVLFVSDGFPNQESDMEWQAARDSLLDPEWAPHPILVAFGFGEADEEVIKILASGQKYTGLACIAAKGLTPTNQLRRIMQELQKSMVLSARNPSQFGINTEGFTVLTSPRSDDLG